MPVLEREISQGESLRCMTWEIPDDLSTCSQETLDRNLKATRTRLMMPQTV